MPYYVRLGVYHTSPHLVLGESTPSTYSQLVVKKAVDTVLIPNVYVRYYCRLRKFMLDRRLTYSMRSVIFRGSKRTLAIAYAAHYGGIYTQASGMGRGYEGIQIEISLKDFCIAEAPKFVLSSASMARQ